MDLGFIVEKCETGFASATLGGCGRHSTTPSREAQFPRISAFRNPHFRNERKVIDHHNQ